MVLAALAALRARLAIPAMLDLLATLVTMARVALEVMAEVQAIRARRVTLATPVTTVQVVTVVTPGEPVIPVTQVLLETQATMVRVAQVELAAMRETPELLATQEIRVITDPEVLAAQAAHKALPVALEIRELQYLLQQVLAVLVAHPEQLATSLLMILLLFKGVTEEQEALVALAVTVVIPPVLILLRVTPALPVVLVTEAVVAVVALVVCHLVVAAVAVVADQAIPVMLVVVVAPVMQARLALTVTRDQLAQAQQLDLEEAPEVGELRATQEQLVIPVLELQVAERAIPAAQVRREQTVMLALLALALLRATPALVEMLVRRVTQVRRAMLALEEH
jgi:hypothetical protein